MEIIKIPAKSLKFSLLEIINTSANINIKVYFDDPFAKTFHFTDLNLNGFSKIMPTFFYIFQY